MNWGGFCKFTKNCLPSYILSWTKLVLNKTWTHKVERKDIDPYSFIYTYLHISTLSTHIYSYLHISELRGGRGGHGRYQHPQHWRGLHCNLRGHLPGAGHPRRRVHVLQVPQYSIVQDSTVQCMYYRNKTPEATNKVGSATVKVSEFDKKGWSQ